MEHTWLLEFCKTDRQREVIAALIEHKTQVKAAQALKIGERGLRKHIKRVKGYAANKAVAPEHGLDRQVPDGYKLKGFSDMRTNGEGKPIWYKVDADKERQEEMMLEYIEYVTNDLKPIDLSYIAKPTQCDADLVNFIPLTDTHIGDWAAAEITGEDWDLDIAKSLIPKVVGRAISQAPKAQTGVLALMGDIAHFDSALQAETPHSRHHLDASGTLQTIAPVIADILTHCIGLMLASYNNVVIPIIKGNHDPAATIWLKTFLPRLFANEPRVSFLTDNLEYQAMTFGKVMIGITHGDKIKPDSAPLVFASEFPKLWGDTEFREFHLGDKHHEATKSVKKGVKTYQHTTMGARNRYPKGMGLSSDRELTVCTYHKDMGRVGTVTINAEMVR